MKIDDPMAPVAETAQRKVWVTPSIMLGTLSGAEGGNSTNPETAIVSGFVAS